MPTVRRRTCWRPWRSSTPRWPAYGDLPGTVDGLHGHCNDPEALDLGGMFGRDEDGVIVFIRGKYKGRSLDDIAVSKPDYLEWMQREDLGETTACGHLANPIGG